MPESREEYDACLASSVRSVAVSNDQIREWGLSIDVVDVPLSEAMTAIFGSDEEFHEVLLETGDGDSPPVERLELDTEDLRVVEQPASVPPASPEAAPVAVE